MGTGVGVLVWGEWIVACLGERKAVGWKIGWQWRWLWDAVWWGPWHCVSVVLCGGALGCVPFSTKLQRISTVPSSCFKHTIFLQSKYVSCSGHTVDMFKTPATGHELSTPRRPHPCFPQSLLCCDLVWALGLTLQAPK